MLGVTTQVRTGKQSAGNKGRRLWVIHDEEAPESAHSAEDVVRYLNTTTRSASINACVDRDSVCGMVSWEDTAWHAGHSATNACSIGIEHDGYAKQDRAEWLDQQGGANTLLRSAMLFREVGMGIYKIEPKLLTGADLYDCVIRGHGSGVCGHGDITRAFGIKGGHTDPGSAFPYDVWLQWATVDLTPTTSKKVDMTTGLFQANADGRGQVFWLDKDGRLLTAWQTPTGAYSATLALGGKYAWAELLGARLSTTLAGAPGRIEVYGLSVYNSPCVIWQDAPNGRFVDAVANIGGG